MDGQPRSMEKFNPNERLDTLIPHIALLFAKRRTNGSVYMDGSHNPLPSEESAAREVIDMVKFTLSDEWLKFCHEEFNYHASPHKGCILR